MVAALVLIAMDVPNPANRGNEERRVLFTFVGVGIAVLVMVLANLFQKRASTATPQATQSHCPRRHPEKATRPRVYCHPRVKRRPATRYILHRTSIIPTGQRLEAVTSVDHRRESRR